MFLKETAMPKGDKLKLKADPEDGTTPISNLLLEAVAIADLTGTEKGLILYLWRQTYGWLVNGKRLKESKLPQEIVANSLGISPKTVYNSLKSLTDKNILLRSDLGQGKGYTYRMNTNISSWNSNSIDLEALKELTGVVEKVEGSKVLLPSQGLTTLSDDTPKVASVNEAKKGEGSNADLPSQGLTTPDQKGLTTPTLYKEILKKELKKEGDAEIPSPINDQTKEVFERVDKLRGYKTTTKRPAEAKAIRAMLKQYTPDQIIDTWKTIKSENFWQDKELFMMTVESQIGAVLHGAHQSKPGKTPTKYTLPEELLQ